mgnify:CR=1 FL=1
MSGIYSTKTPELSTLGDVDINLSTIANNDVLQYNSTSRQWDNGPIDLTPVLFTVYKSATSTTSNPVINWTTPEINIGGGAWDGAGTYTVGLAGYYDINFQAQMRTQTPNSNGNFIAIRQNGTVVSSANHEMVNVGGTEEYINMYISRLIYLNINDAITTSATIKNSGVINNSFLKIIRVSP